MEQPQLSGLSAFVVAFVAFRDLKVKVSSEEEDGVEKEVVSAFELGITPASVPSEEQKR